MKKFYIYVYKSSDFYFFCIPKFHREFDIFTGICIYIYKSYFFSFNFLCFIENLTIPMFHRDLTISMFHRDLQIHLHLHLHVVHFLKHRSYKLPPMNPYVSRMEEQAVELRAGDELSPGRKEPASISNHVQQQGPQECARHKVGRAVG